MKKNYCYLRRTSGISKNDVIYKVPIGTSVREMRKKALIEAYSNDVGTYFKLWDNDCDRALEFVSKMVFGKIPRLFEGFRVETISVDRLYKMIVDDSFDEYEGSLSLNHNRIEMLKFLSLTSQSQSSLSVSQRDCQSVSRKNLSHGKMSDAQSVTILSVLILVLFLIAGFLENVERCLL